MKNKIPDILDRIRENPKNVRFTDLCKICDWFFGKPRQKGSSHRIYRTPWAGDPRINIQDHKGMAKIYKPVRYPGLKPVLIRFAAEDCQARGIYRVNTERRL
jgi:hypothetical protein